MEDTEFEDVEVSGSCEAIIFECGRAGVLVSDEWLDSWSGLQHGSFDGAVSNDRAPEIICEYKQD